MTFNVSIFSITILIIMVVCIKRIIVMIICTVTLRIMTFSKKTKVKTILSIMTISKKNTQHNDIQYNDIQHNTKLNSTLSIMITSIMAECCYTVSFMLIVTNKPFMRMCRYAECCYVEWSYAKYCYAECLGAAATDAGGVCSKKSFTTLISNKLVRLLITDPSIV